MSKKPEIERNIEDLIGTRADKSCIKTPKDLKKHTDEYFHKRYRAQKIITLNGLLLYLGVNKKQWKTWEETEGFDNVCERCALIFEHTLEERLFTENRPIGSIFQLKSAHGRSDNNVVQTQPANYIYMYQNELKAIQDHRALSVNNYAQNRTELTDLNGRKDTCNLDMETSQDKNQPGY